MLYFDEKNKNVKLLDNVILFNVKTIFVNIFHHLLFARPFEYQHGHIHFNFEYESFVVKFNFVILVFECFISPYRRDYNIQYNAEWLLVVALTLNFLFISNV